MHLLNHRDRRRARRFNTLLSKRRVKNKHDFNLREWKPTRRWADLAAPTLVHACLRGVGYSFIWKKSVTLQKSLEDTAKRNLNNFSQCANGLFTIWTVYRRTVILNAKMKLALVWVRFCLCTRSSFIYSWNNRHIAVVVAKLYFQAASGICSPKKKIGLKTSGSYHSTKNSRANFRKFPWANGTVFFQCGRR